MAYEESSQITATLVSRKGMLAAVKKRPIWMTYLTWHLRYDVKARRMSWVAQYSRWDFLRDKDGVLPIWFSLHYFTYLFIYVIWSKTSALVQLINYHLFDLLLSLKLKSRIPETSSHFTAQLLSVLQVTSLCATSLTQRAYLNESVQFSLVSMEISFIYLFFAVRSS